jgi:L-arabinokinase
MGHRIILSKMAEMGRAAGRELIADPMGGYLANLALEDYKTYFRPYLPEKIRGSEFLARYGPTIDAATTVEADVEYAVQSATDHHVHEARRVVNFVQFLEEAARQTPHTAERSRTLDKAGHLMYGSHVAYTRDALLGADEADVLVDLVRSNEREGFYGAKITGGGLGGTVAVLANVSPQADEAIGEIARIYQERTGKAAEVFWGSSPGAWEVGTEVTRL